MSAGTFSEGFRRSSSLAHTLMSNARPYSLRDIRAGLVTEEMRRDFGCDYDYQTRQWRVSSRDAASEARDRTQRRPARRERVDRLVRLYQRQHDIDGLSGSCTERADHFANSDRLHHKSRVPRRYQSEHSIHYSGFAFAGLPAGKYVPDVLASNDTWCLYDNGAERERHKQCGQIHGDGRLFRRTGSFDQRP